MSKLYRPYIPLAVRCRIAVRQLGGPEALRGIISVADAKIVAEGRSRAILGALLVRLAAKLGCEARDLQLDHNPALAVRRQIRINGAVVGYEPPANDPAHLVYREKHAHRIKTLVRGDGAQYPDRVLIKRERRREKGRSAGAKMRRRRYGKGLARYSAWPKGKKLKSRNNLRRKTGGQ